jgi:predicted nucleic acid-binding protein
VPFEKAVDAYSRVAARQARTKQVLSFDGRDELQATP